MIELAKGLELPIDAVTEAFAFLARRGAGKSYGAMKFAEGMHAAGGRFAAIDPVGRWWGLRLAADGRSPGIKVPILGGFHGDIPLAETSGALVADLITDKRSSVIHNIRRMSNAAKRRFVLAFISRIYERQADNDSPVPIHIFFEEAQKFAPQRPLKGSERLLGAIEEICREGRNFGIGYTLISQRPQAVNKEVLNLVECLFALQTTGAHERKSIRDWMDAHGLDAGDLFRDLPTLQTGEAIVWSPGWLRLMKRVKILKRWTFDSSATPKVGAKPSEHGTLAPVDLEALKAAMAEATEEAEANDPAKLKARIRELERKLKSVKPEVERVEVPVISDEAMDKIRRFEDAALKAAASLASSFEPLRKAIAEVSGRMEQKAVHLPRWGAASPMAPNRRPEAPKPNGEVKLVGGARRMLEALAQNEGKGLSWTQVAVRAFLSTKTGTTNKYKGYLRKAGFVSESAHSVEITPQGIEWLGGEWREVTMEEVRAHWRGRLVGAGKLMFDCLVERCPDFVGKAEMSKFAKVSMITGTFNKYLGHIKSTNMIEKSGSKMRLLPEYL